METLTIEVRTAKARKLIDDLIDLGIISLKSSQPGPEDDLTDTDWLAGAMPNPSFDFLHDEAEAIYTIADGRPINHEK